MIEMDPYLWAISCDRCGCYLGAPSEVVYDSQYRPVRERFDHAFSAQEAAKKAGWRYAVKTGQWLCSSCVDAAVTVAVAEPASTEFAGWGDTAHVGGAEVRLKHSRKSKGKKK